jgi:ribonuclease J
MTSSNGQKPQQPTLRVIPLGGLHEIGKNTCVFEYGDDLMLVDAGLAFPSDGMHGVNVVLPDTSYLRENQKRIRAMIVTHGHEDHIGGIPHHLKHFNIPVIYGPRLAMSMLQGKMEEAGVTDRTTIQTVRPRDVVQVGQSFKVEFIRNTHSIADSFSLAITTPVGVVVFTGDFKFDHTPWMARTSTSSAWRTTASRVCSACSRTPPMPSCRASHRPSGPCSPTSIATSPKPKAG